MGSGGGMEVPLQLQPMGLQVGGWYLVSITVCQQYVMVGMQSCVFELCSGLCVTDVLCHVLGYCSVVVAAITVHPALSTLQHPFPNSLFLHQTVLPGCSSSSSSTFWHLVFMFITSQLLPGSLLMLLLPALLTLC
jgi:hypothetical protein